MNNLKYGISSVPFSRSVVSTSLRPLDCSLSGSSVHGILQARILEWVAISFSRGSSQARDRTRVSCIAGGCFIVWATWEAQFCPTLCDPWTTACQASLSFTVFQSLFKFMSIQLVMVSDHLILYCSLLLLPSIFPSIRVFSNESALRIGWKSVILLSSAFASA